jgi:hypothetical protein
VNRDCGICEASMRLTESTERVRSAEESKLLKLECLSTWSRNFSHRKESNERRRVGMGDFKCMNELDQ